YFNGTGSADVMATALQVFPHGLRVANFLSVSDSPIELDKTRLLNLIRQYQIDGKLMFDPADPRTPTALAAYAALADSIHEPPRNVGLEDGELMLKRIGRRHVITDDNMGAEWGTYFDANWR